MEIFPILLWISLILAIVAILLAFCGGLSFVEYAAGTTLLFLAVYHFAMSIAKRALRCPEKVRARVSAALYIFGFFWLVFSISVLLLSVIFYAPASASGRIGMLKMIVFFALILLGLSAISLLTAKRIWR